MIAGLTWIGSRARWVLIVGAFAGLAFPEGATFLRPALPFFVSMVYALAMLRIAPLEVIGRLAHPRLLLIAIIQITALLVLTPALAFGVAHLAGLGPETEAALVYTFAAPPIASSAAMCLIIGFRAARALEITIIASLMMPLVGPLVVKTLIGADLAITAFDLGMRMAAMILGGLALALIGRRIMGAARIARHSAALDGVAALAFLLFIMPLFDGVRTTVLAEPMLALGFLVLSLVIVIGMVAVALRLPGDRDRNGAFGVVWGTRSVAIYLAALPPDPIFTLFVAIYQIPMAALALVFRRSPPSRPPENDRSAK